MTPHSPPDNRKAIAVMLLAVGAFAFMDSLLKVLSPHYPPMEVAALRGLASWPIVLVFALARGRGRSLVRVRFGLHLLRGVLGVAMMGSFIYALRVMSLSNAYCLFFVAPLIIAALSGVILGERVGRARWIAIGVGFVGVIVLLRPSTDGFFDTASLMVLGAALAYALSAFTVRVLGRTDSTESMVFWLTGMMALGAGALAWPELRAVEPRHYGVIVGIGLIGCVGQFAVTYAFRFGEAALIAPLEYTALLWALGIDFVGWGTVPQPVMLAGAAIIVGSGVFLVRSETAGAREAEDRISVTQEP